MIDDSDTDAELLGSLAGVVSGVLGVPAWVRAVRADVPIPQGASGGRVRAYSATYVTPRGQTGTLRVVSKEASLLERRVLALLSAQRQAIPVTWVPAPARPGRARIVQEYADERPVSAPDAMLMEQTADALAALHAANLGPPPAWLPRADRSFVDELYLRATQQTWEQNLADPDFASEFGRYTEPLHAALARLLSILADLTREQQTLTLINTDLNPAHLRLTRGKPCFIDWDQAHYGSLYLDLPNVFSLEHALRYRDALARHGLAIAPAEFLERYREVGRYLGLRYLEVGLLHWRDRGDDWPFQRRFLYFCLSVALHGR